MLCIEPSNRNTMPQNNILQRMACSIILCQAVGERERASEMASISKLANIFISCIYSSVCPYSKINKHFQKLKKTCIGDWDRAVGSGGVDTNNTGSLFLLLFRSANQWLATNGHRFQQKKKYYNPDSHSFWFFFGQEYVLNSKKHNPTYK